VKDQDKIDGDGIQKFFEDIKIDIMDASTLAFAFLCQAKAMGEFTKDEFVRGLTAVKGDTVKDVQANWKNNVTALLNNETQLKEIYLFTFSFAKEEGARNINFEVAKSLWEILLKDRFAFLQKWMTYLDALPEKKKSDIPKDTWNMLIEFHLQTKGDLTKYVDDGAWPVMIDEFVEYLKK